MQTPSSLMASFTGSGTLGATPLLRLLEALENRGALFHKAVPGVVEVARERRIEDVQSVLGEGGFSVRTIQLRWEPFLTPPMLATEGLDLLRDEFKSFPQGLRGFRVRLGYAFPKREAEPLDLIVHMLDGQRYEVRLAIPASLVLDLKKKPLSRANALLLADLAEALYDVLDPAYGAIRLEPGVLPDQLPHMGWGFYCSQLVETAGRAAVEKFAASCYKSWELPDGGWFLAPKPLDELDTDQEAERQSLFAPCRHWNLEGMRGSIWKAN